MKNPLLVPELREMLSAHRVDEIRDFCAFTPPEVTAEFLSAMNPEEGRTILEMLEPEMRSLVFAALEDEAKLAVLEPAGRERGGRDRPGHARGRPATASWSGCPPTSSSACARSSSAPSRKTAQPLLEAMDEALMPEPEKLEELSAEEIANEVNQHLETYRFVGGRVERARPPGTGLLGAHHQPVQGQPAAHRRALQGARSTS